MEKSFNEGYVLPEDYMVIFPVLKNNILASALESEIKEFWTRKGITQNSVQLHKHQEGQIINLQSSVK